MTPAESLIQELRRIAAEMPDRAFFLFLPAAEAAPSRASIVTTQDDSNELAKDTTKADDAIVSPSKTRHKTRRTLTERAQDVLDREGDVGLTRAEWVKRLGTGTGRLISRIIQFKAVPSTSKGTGKGHRSRIVHAKHMVAALMTIEDVQSSKVAPPNWYDQVMRAA
jgi:hypothetical protein